MKILLMVIFISAALGGLGFALWMALSFGADRPLDETPSYTPFPVTNNNQPLPDQKAVEGTQRVIADAFLQQIQNSNLIQLEGTTLSSIYALQEWGDENKGGEALLMYTSAGKWQLVSLGGGSWSVMGLVAYGVPESVAQRLITGRGY